MSGCLDRTTSYFGGSYGYDDTKYGVPIVEERSGSAHARDGIRSALRGGGQGLDWRVRFVTGRRSRCAATSTRSLKAQISAPSFKNNTDEIELMAGHRAIGRMKGSSAAGSSIGHSVRPAQRRCRRMSISVAFAAFLFEEVTWPHFTFQFGGRVDHTILRPVGEDERSFTSGSGSVGLLFTPAAADERLTFAVSLARAARNPALEELFYFGPHPGNFAFEIGNPDLEPEHAIGFDLSMRWRALPRVGGDHVFPERYSGLCLPQPAECGRLEDRLGALEDRFAGRELDIAGGRGFPIIENVAADSVLQGVEAHGDFGLTSNLFAEFGLDYVRGTLKGPTSRCPACRRSARSSACATSTTRSSLAGTSSWLRRRIASSPTETATDGYQLLKLFAAYSVQTGRVLHTITARLDNATNELYRNHLSLIKELAPEMGRNFKLLYNIRF